MERVLTEIEVRQMRMWYDSVREENKDAQKVGFRSGLDFVMEVLEVDREIKHTEQVVGVLGRFNERGIDEMKVKMEENKIQAMWNLGLATGICWCLELFGYEDSNYAGLKG